MNISITGFTQKEKTRISCLIKPLTQIAPWWLNEIEVVKIPGDDGMRCAPSKKYRRIIIEIYEGSLLYEDDKLLKFMTHEISHCYNEPILDLMDLIAVYIPDEANIEAMRKNVMRSIEEQTEDLAIMFGDIIG